MELGCHLPVGVAALPLPDPRIRELSEANEILSAKSFPRKLAPTLVKYEGKGETNRRDVASDAAVSPLPNRVHVVEGSCQIPTTATEHGLCVNEIRVGQTEHRI